MRPFASYLTGVATIHFPSGENYHDKTIHNAEASG